MALRSAPEPLYLELEVSYAFYTDLNTEPTDYSRPIEIESLSMTPSAQQTVRVLGRNISTAGDVLLSVQRPSGEPTAIELRAIAYDPQLQALAMGGEVAEVTQVAGTAISAARTLIQGRQAKLPGRFIDPASVVVGIGDSAATGVVGSNNALTWTALEPTTSAASGITVTIVDPATASAALAVSVSGTDISVSLATDGTSDEISTAAQVLAAVNAHPAASALVVASHTTGSDGTGVVAAVAETALTGGSVVAASAYTVDPVSGLIMPTASAATGVLRVYAQTEGATIDRYSGGSATSKWMHLTGKARNAKTLKLGVIDVWQCNLASQEPIVAPQSDSGFVAVLSGDAQVPSIDIGGITPVRAIQFDDRRV